MGHLIAEGIKIGIIIYCLGPIYIGRRSFSGVVLFFANVAISPNEGFLQIEFVLLGSNFNFFSIGIV